MVADQGYGRRPWFRFLVMSGVKVPPAGVTIKDLIDNYCDGMEEGHVFKGYLPEHPGILPASMNNIPLDYGSKERLKLDDSGSMIVLSDKDNIKDGSKFT